MICVVVICDDLVAGACGMQMNSGIMCGAEGGIEWAKDEGEEWRNEVGEEKGLKDIGGEL